MKPKKYFSGNRVLKKNEHLIKEDGGSLCSSNFLQSRA